MNPPVNHRYHQAKGPLNNHPCRQVKGLRRCLRNLLVGLQLMPHLQKTPPASRAHFHQRRLPRRPLRVQPHVSLTCQTLYSRKSTFSPQPFLQLLAQLHWCGRARRQRRRRCQRGVQANRLHLYPRLPRPLSQRQASLLMFQVSHLHCRSERIRRILLRPRPGPRRQTRLRPTMCQRR